MNSGDPIVPFVKATIDTFRLMAKVAVVPGEPGPTPVLSLCAFRGVIHLSGQATGSVALAFPEGTAHGIAKALMGTTTAAPMVADLMGEIINVVAGAAKRDPRYEETIISLPEVGQGESACRRGSRGPSGSAGMAVRFASDLGRFDLELFLEG